MAFKKSAAITEFLWPVTVDVPVAGKHVSHIFNARFAIPVGEEATTILDEIMGGQVDEIGLCRKIWVGWQEGHVQDEDGSPLPETPDNLEHFVSLPYFRRGLIRSYIEAQAGKKAARKN
jgi:hypothetical protein